MILVQIPATPLDTDVLAVGVSAAGLQAAAIDADLAALARDHLRAGQLAAAAGEVHRIPLPDRTPSLLLLVGLGDGSAADLRIAGVALGRTVRGLAETRSVAVVVDAPEPAGSRALAEGLVLGGYDYSLASTAEDTLHTVQLTGTVDRAGLAAGDAAADAAGWARDLGNMPAGLLNPARMGELAEQQLTPSGCAVDVRDEQWLTEQGFGGLLAVGGGSATGPRLIEARYRPRGSARAPHVVLVGKGITFDSGGLNLKPADSMRTMHTDMCGGAAVLAALQYAALQKLPLRVTALVPAAENAVSGTAMRPSDIIRHYGGRTTEIGNTDAEGRLVLADALAYAVARLKPDVLIDVATLTGAMKVALGDETAGYLANDDELSAALEAAAADTGEAIWRMPLEHRYAGLLDSPVADARNDPGTPGAITAALFLQAFVGNVPWAHVDIAGPSRAAQDGPVFSQGATGFGTRLLARYLEGVAAG